MSSTQDAVIASIPSYLRQFVVLQHYDEYTPQDHAVWRYVMRRNLDFLSDVAHPAYLVGLQKTGINLDYIPHIDEMNDKLSRIGWKAVVVDGFVPPAAFMEFQAHKILVISAEIRNFKNILYTPAPDIIHEAAGHAPIIADEKYALYLQKIGEYGSKSVFSKLDYEIYEAIRELSIIKEYPDATIEEVEKAEKTLEEKIAANTKPSESAYLARLHWWTVEYGLIGTPENFKIYGAGILSSVGESKECMKPKVIKLPLSVECAEFNYDITQMQPQLFVARDFDHLLEVLEEFADSMCFRKGGVESAEKVIASENVGTLVLGSGLQISGVFTEARSDNSGNACFIKTIGQTALAFNDKHLDGHGTDYHAEGFSSPIGLLKGSDIPLEDWSDPDLLNNGISEGRNIELHYASGITAKGKLLKLLRKNGKVLVLTMSDCTVTDVDGTILYKPEWGTMDIAVGHQIISAYSGSADKENFNVYPPKSEKKAIKVNYTDSQKNLFRLYEKLDVIRNSVKVDISEIITVYERVRVDYHNNWLIQYEILDLLMTHYPENDLISEIISSLSKIGSGNQELKDLVESGLRMLGVEEFS
jgi:phenylalanine-4-hydroxylase